MKKKWIIIGSCGIAFIALVTILLIILLGGASFSDMSQQVFNSMNKVQTVDSVTTVKDGEIIVYQYGKKVEIKDSNKAVVTTSESEYNSNFEFLPSLVNTVLSELNLNNIPSLFLLTLPLNAS